MALELVKASLKNSKHLCVNDSRQMLKNNKMADKQVSLRINYNTLESFPQVAFHFHFNFPLE